MKRTILAILGLGLMAVPASAQRWDGPRHWGHGRDRTVIIERDSPQISGGTLAAIFALQLMQQAQKAQAETFDEPAPRRRQYAPPLK